MDHRPNIRAKTIKLEEYIGLNLFDIGLGMAFLDMTPKAEATEEKKHKFNCIKIENFDASNDTTKKVKKQPTGCIYLIRDLYLEYKRTLTTQ